MKVAALQMTSGPDVAANLAVAAQLLREAADRGAMLAVLPENFAFLGIADTDKHAVAEDDLAEAWDTRARPAPIQQFLAARSRELSLWIVAGTMPMRAEHAPGDAPRVAAASLVYGADGARVARYDKIHLFDVDVADSTGRYRESANVLPGRTPRALATPAGMLGLSVCYDMRFPELYRALSAAGAELFAVPSAFTVPTGEAHWESLLRARAIENLAYVIAAAQTGTHPGGRQTYGHSMIVDYWGRVLAELPAGTGCVVASVEPAAQEAARASFPALRHRVL